MSEERHFYINFRRALNDAHVWWIAGHDITTTPLLAEAIPYGQAVMRVADAQVKTGYGLTDVQLVPVEPYEQLTPAMRKLLRMTC